VGTGSKKNDEKTEQTTPEKRDKENENKGSTNYVEEVCE
jgi:hypothetical protein